MSNSGTCPDNYNFSYSATGTVFGVALDRSSAFLNRGQSTTVTASYSVGAPGTGTLNVSASGTLGGAWDNGYYNVTATPPPPPPPGAPVVDASPSNFVKQEYGMCASACFALATTRSTVPYFSLDAPRHVTLTYNSDRVNPRPFVLVNVSPDLSYGSWPTQYQLQVKVNGAFVTFVNGEQTLKFAYTGTAPVRIGGQFDASSYATGVYAMDILVSALHSGNTLITNALPTKLAVVNETSAPAARGWIVTGIQRLYPTADSSALITSGDGSAVYLPFTGVVYVSPAGEFSQLKLGTPSGGSGWTRRWADSTKVVFDNTGRMIQVLDRFGNATSVTYDGSGRVSQIKDPLNIPITLTYGANGLASVRDSMGRVTTVTVDASRRLTAIADPDGISTQYGYDASLRLNSITDRRGKTTVFGYDAQSGKLATLTAPAVPVYQSGTVSPVTNLAAWQKLGVPYVATSGTPFTPPRADTVRAKVTEPGGAVTRFTVNGFGQPLVALRPLRDTVTVTYTANGQPTVVKRPGYGSSEADTTYYNASGLPTYVRPAGLSATNIRYAAYGQADSTWGTAQPGVRRFIGVKGRVDSVRVGIALVRLFYNARGQVDSIKDGSNVRTAKNTRAGANGNLSRTDYPGSRFVTYSYDAYGRPTSVARSGLATETRYYSVINRADSVRNGVDAQPVKFGYDQLFTTSVTDPKGQVFGVAYNALGWATGRTDPTGTTEYIDYSIDGNARRRTNRRGQTITVGYDSLHRVTSNVGSLSMSWSYVNHGRIVTASGGGVSTDTVYLNVFGNPDSIKTVMAGRTYWRRYRYTQAGKVDTVDVSGAGIPFFGRKYVYHAGHGELTDIRLSGATTTLGVNNNLQVISRLFSGLDVESRQYNTLHRVMQIATTEPYKLWTQRDVGFDVANRVSEQLFGAGNTGEIYGYDGLGRLSYRWSGHYADTLPPWCYDPDNGVACYPKTTWVTTSADSFAYDPAGNRTDRGGSYLTGNRVTQFDGCSYTTDLDGNVMSRTGASCTRGAGSFTWHAEGLLATVTIGSSTVTLKYDAAGRLVRKDVNGVPQSHYLWDGGNLLAELDGNGTVKRAEYSYYPGLDRLHALIIGSAIYYAHVDAIGSVIGLTDVGKNLQRSYAFDAWGTLVSGTDFLPFNGYDRARWKGALLLIPELNLYYMRNRWYEGGTGRLLSEDPLGLAGGLNPYAYAGNDPINLSDPSGLIICDGWCGTPSIGGGGSAFGTPSFLGLGAVSGPSMADLLAGARAAWAAGYEGVVYTSEDGLVNAQWTCPACVRAVEWLTRLGARITAPLQRAIHKAHQLTQGRDITWSRVGENVRAVWRVPGGDPAGAYADWTRIIDAEGHTVWLWKHSYVGGQYQGTIWYVMDYMRMNAGP